MPDMDLGRIHIYDWWDVRDVIKWWSIWDRHLYVPFRPSYKKLPLNLLLGQPSRVGHDMHLEILLMLGNE